MKSRINDVAIEMKRAATEVATRVDQYLEVMQKTQNKDHSTNDLDTWSTAAKQLSDPNSDSARKRAIRALHDATKIVAEASPQEAKEVANLKKEVDAEIGNMNQSIERIRTRDKEEDLFKPVRFSGSVYGDPKSEDMGTKEMLKAINSEYKSFHAAVSKYEKHFNRASQYGTFAVRDLGIEETDTSEIKKEFGKK